MVRWRVTVLIVSVITAMMVGPLGTTDHSSSRIGAQRSDDGLQVYWSTQDAIVRAGLPQGTVERVFTRQVPTAIALDAVHQHIYWIEAGANVVKRADVDGGNRQSILSRPSGQLRALAIDASERQLYWATSEGQIRRMPAAGGERTTVVRAHAGTSAIALDTASNQVYWTNRENGTLKRARLDGSDVTTLWTNENELLQAIAVSPKQNALFWGTENRIWRADLEGGDPQQVFDSVAATIRDLAVQASSATLYWTDANRIHRAAFDGSSRERVNISEKDFYGLAVDEAAERLYVTDALGRVQRMRADGSDVETLANSPLFRPNGIAFDAHSGHVYWRDRELAAIRRARPDGSNVETVLSSPGLGNRSGLSGLAVAPSRNLLAWPEGGRIRGANLDGSDVRTLIRGAEGADIAIDSEAGKVYWVETFKERIRRADLDGTDVEDLPVDARSPTGIAVDPAGGHIYWTETGQSRIRRAELDGSQAKLVLNDALMAPLGIAVDPTADKLYWTDIDARSVQRVGFDGTSIETVAQHPDSVLLDIMVVRKSNR